MLNREGYRGYIPLDEVRWTESGEDDEKDKAAPEEEGFMVVGRKGKASAKTISRAHSEDKSNVAIGLVPPFLLAQTEDKISSTTLLLTIYSPTVLSTHFVLPPSLLPLVGAFLGNDYTSSPAPASSSSSSGEDAGWGYMRLFFERGQSPYERIQKVVRGVRGVLESALAANPTKRGRKSKRPGSVMELIEACVEVLVVRPLDTLPPTFVAGLNFGALAEGGGLKEKIVEKIVEVTLQYAVPDYNFQMPSASLPSSADIPDPSSPTTTTDYDDTDTNTDSQHPGSSGPLLPTIPVHLYAPYAASQLSPRLLDPFISRTSWPRTGLEDPDRESVSRWVGEKLRVSAWTILGVGRGEHSQGDTAVDLEQEHGTADELGMHVESDTGEEVDRGLEMLRGRLKALAAEVTGESEDDDEEVSVEEESFDELEDSGMNTSAAPSEGKTDAFFITEYVRKGSRLVPTSVGVPSLDALLDSLEPPFIPPPAPALSTSTPGFDTRSKNSVAENEKSWHEMPYLWPVTERITLFLRFLKSDVPTIRALVDRSTVHRAKFVEEREKLGAILAVRWIAALSAERAQEAGGTTREGKEREKERWMRDEAKALLRAFRWASTTTSPHSLTKTPSGGTAESKGEDVLTIDERNVQLTAQIITAMESIELLAQSLFLAEEFPSPARRFSGRTFHSLLNDLSAPTVSASAEHSDDFMSVMWGACEDGLAGAFRDPIAKKSKKGKKETSETAKVSASKNLSLKSKGVAAGRMFGLLADLEG